jgi:hypothetical protein
VPVRPPADFPVRRGEDYAPVPHPIWDAVAISFTEPFVGITTDGRVRGDLFTQPTGEADPALVAAAARYLDSLDTDQRRRHVVSIDSPVWREWTNAFPRWPPTGTLLIDLAEHQRGAAMAMIAASLSDRGYARLRDIMRLDQALGDLIGYMQDTLSEWVYFLTVFGEPSATEPWGWQLMGHHLDMHCFVMGEQVVLTPMFMGAEVCAIGDGPLALNHVFRDERDRALALMDALTPSQRRQAILYSSILTRDLPPELDHPSNGRMRAGAGADNAIIAYEGLCATELEATQRELLMALFATHTAPLRARQRHARLFEIERHLDETQFAWMGGTGQDDAFFYKLHSPVVLIEFDCHKGVFLDADEPLAFHTHVVVRTPNGNDYGRALRAAPFTAPVVSR